MKRRLTTYAGHNRRGGIPLPEHAHPLVREFIHRMNVEDTTYAEISRRAGVGVDSIRFWRTRHMPRLDLFEAALNALDLELAIVPKGTRKLRAPAIRSESRAGPNAAIAA